jgi:DNA-binding GntR family transcriptional regulator
MVSLGQHSLHDELLSRLRKLIIEGEIQPGTKIPERSLCERFGVSRTPLREAIKVLAAEGLVRLEPHRGAVVVQPTPGELDECMPISAAIEALSGELACEHITDEEIAAIKAVHQKMIEAHKKGDHEEYLACNRKIHECILAAARNPLLASIYDATYFRMGRQRFGQSLPRETIDLILMDHEEIIEALTARQSQRLSKTLQRHVERMFVVYRKALHDATPAASVGKCPIGKG